MKLRGIHVNAYNQDVQKTLERGKPAIVKTLDFGPDWVTLKEEHDIRFLLGRVWCDDDAALTPTPEAAAERLFARVWEKVGRSWAALDAIETPWNEAHQRGDDLALHARACRRFCELAHRHDMPVAVGCFSVGNPEPSEFARFWPAMEVADYLALHEYWLPGNFNAPWWVGRYRRLLDALPADLRRPVIVSECGIDGGLEGKSARYAGWRAYGLTQTQYALSLTAFLDYLDADVLGVTVFNAGDYAGGRWGAFEIANTPAVDTWLAAGPREWTPPTPEQPPVEPPAPAPEPEPPPTTTGEYVVGPGVLAAMEAEGDAPASNECYLDGLSLTMGKSGVLYAYTPPTGVVAYDPKAPGQ